MNAREGVARGGAQRGRRNPSGGAAGGDAAGPLRFTVGASPLGALLVASAGRGLRAVILGDDEAGVLADLRARFPRVDLVEADQALAPLLAAVTRSIDLPDAEFTEPLDTGGTEFQRAVWRELRRIPAGETATYSEIAGRIGRPAAVRAVGAACGANPLAIVVPCHRVVGSNGALTGYRWGLARKQRLLELESRTARGARE